MTFESNIDSENDEKLSLEIKLKQETTLIQLGHILQSSKNCAEEFRLEEFPSKVGGRPLWLYPNKALGPTSTKCEKCNGQMVLLLQLYAGEEFPEDAYHRYLYLWICPKGACHKQPQSEGKSLRLYRSQLPLQNPYYQFNPDTQTTVLLHPTSSSVCTVCGVKGTHVCSGCQQVYYCCQTHQRWHWEQSHRDECPPRTPWRYLGPPVFPEYLVESEPEPPPSTSPSLTGGRRSLQNDLHESDTGVDPWFLEFQARLARAPTQVLRYLRTDVSSAPPLYIHEDLPPAPSPCPRCGSPRTLECQVLSTLLNYLDLKTEDSNALDFGSLFLYTCETSCALQETYAEEVVDTQSFSAHSIRFGKPA
ncbi:Programmed cell death protein 2 [Coelomomyces lativittatus]|nr:Programmed cell death protein 2 [Coelomomyces lativittatus]KAJ1506439.1 Programmed cell death protein 2 [Coelomomyces lativittatus]KAJ1514677.1 Programmed cell death protein 2 [Coelomomyces lativittatus]